MAALNEKIYIGADYEEPLISFIGKEVVSVATIEDSDLIDSSLPINTMEVEVKWNPSYEGYNLLNTPYGTTLWQFVGDDFKHRFFVKKIERVSKNICKIYCHDIIGLFDHQYHIGGIYNGVPVKDVIHEMLENDEDLYNFIIFSEEVGETKISGWLPYDTIRRNLLKICFALNIICSYYEDISILDEDYKSKVGQLYLSYPTSDYNNIPSSNVIAEGSIEYPDKVSKVTVIEHSFQKDINGDRITLVDNTDTGTVEDKIYFFDSPIDIDSLEGEDLTISAVNENFVVVSGGGYLTGIPYYDNCKAITRSIEVNGESKEISIDDQYLVSPLNSEFVADRLVSYYSSINKVNGYVKVTNEKIGKLYRFLNVFGEWTIGFLSKLSCFDSSFTKGEATFIENYTTQKHGNQFNYYAIADYASKITISEGTKRARFILIGGGSGGDSGLAGSIPDDPLDGGEGGEGGNGGDGGKIKIIDISDPTPGDYYVTTGSYGLGGAYTHSTTDKNYGTSGTDSTLTTPDGVIYSSGDSGYYLAPKGISNIFNGTVYAPRGIDGVKGGNGGRGSSTSDGEDGEDVVYRGHIYSGGKGSSACVWKVDHYEGIDLACNAGGAGGNGASPKNLIDRSFDAFVRTYGYSGSGSLGEEYAYIWEGLSGPVINRTDLANASNTCGSGGDGGHGGIGRGGSGEICELNEHATSSNNIDVHVEGTPANRLTNYRPEYDTDASSGGFRGVNGCVLCYTDSPVESEYIRWDAPETPTVSIDSNSIISITFVTVQGPTMYYAEKKEVGADDWVISYSVSNDGGQSGISKTVSMSSSSEAGNVYYGKDYTFRVVARFSEDHFESVSGETSIVHANRGLNEQAILNVTDFDQYSITFQWDEVAGANGKYYLVWSDYRQLGSHSYYAYNGNYGDPYMLTFNASEQTHTYVLNINSWLFSPYFLPTTGYRLSFWIYPADVSTSSPLTSQYSSERVYVNCPGTIYNKNITKEWHRNDPSIYPF